MLQNADSGCHILALILAGLGGVMCVYHYIVVDARLSQKRAANQASGHRTFLVITFVHFTLSLTLLTFIHLLYLPISCARS